MIFEVPFTAGPPAAFDTDALPDPVPDQSEVRVTFGPVKVTVARFNLDGHDLRLMGDLGYPTLTIQVQRAVPRATLLEGLEAIRDNCAAMAVEAQAIADAHAPLLRIP